MSYMPIQKNECIFVILSVNVEKMNHCYMCILSKFQSNILVVEYLISCMLGYNYHRINPKMAKIY